MEVGKDFVLTDKKTASDSIHDLVRTLLLKAKELSEQTMQSITSDPPVNGVKSEEVKTEEKPEIKAEVKAENETNTNIVAKQHLAFRKIK